MSLRIRLIGRPCALRDGQQVRGPRGRKAWALLAVLLLADRPISRRSLANLLFPDADDPLGALRWTLSELRRGLAGQVIVGGDPVRVTVDPGCRIDLIDLLRGDQDVDCGPADELLDGADGTAGVDFDLWLTTARHRLSTIRAARLRRTPDEVLAGTAPAVALQAGDGFDAISRIEAGQAAMAAGAVDTGLDQLRAAVRLAAGHDDPRLHATALAALGSALIHGLPAHTGEGTAALRAAARLARQAGDRLLAADALRDLAFVENTSGRVAPARRLLAAAEQAAGDDRPALSAVRALEGMYLADRGRHDRALAVLRRSAELAESTGRFRQVVWANAIAARSLLQLGEHERAAEYAELCLRVAREEQWTAIQPWLEAMLAQLDLASGNVDRAELRLRHAWSLSLVLNDWCWQGLAAGGLGLVAFARGDLPEALRWLAEADRRAWADPDRYTWIHAWVQDALCQVTVAAGLPRASGDVRRLARIAAAASLPDFTVRAQRHHAALGARAVAATPASRPGHGRAS
ncbi:MAG TPA: hypothetical protein VIL37_19340 [Natronosporangium sp.]